MHGIGDVEQDSVAGACSGSKGEFRKNRDVMALIRYRRSLSSRSVITATPKTGNIAGLWRGGDHGPGTQRTSITNQCHDITVFAELALAAGACSGNGILLDISDPVHPARLDQVIAKNFASWQSATFNNDGTKVIFTDEWGGGTRPRCRATDPPTWGADAIFDIVDRKLRFRNY